MDIKLGTDPEFFLHDGIQFISAHDKVPGTKANPVPISKTTTIQPDGLAGEWGMTPASSKEEFEKLVLKAKADVRKAIPKEFAIHYVPEATFNSAYYASLPDECKEIGCSPDYVYSEKIQKDPKPREIDVKGFMKSNTKFAGGHIHIGWTKDESDEDPMHVRQCTALAYMIGQYVKTFCNNNFYSRNLYNPSQNARSIPHRASSIYGVYSSFRPKPYGMELRAPNNSWLNNPIKIRLMYPFIDGMIKACESKREENYYLIGEVYDAFVRYVPKLKNKTHYDYAYIVNFLKSKGLTTEDIEFIQHHLNNPPPEYRGTTNYNQGVY